jgi:hypothetical protein
MTMRWIARRVRVAAGAWDRFWFEPGPPSRLGLARLVFCGAAFLFYWPRDFAEWATAAPVFWMPIPLFETLHVTPMSAGWLSVVQGVWKLSLAMSAIGLFTRASTAVTALLALYLLGLPHNFGATQHFDTLVVFAFFVLAMSRAGDARSIDAWRRGRHADGEHGGPRSSGWRRARDGRWFGDGHDPDVRPEVAGPEYTWPIRAMWVMTSLVFFGAGSSKLRHSGLDWALSDNLRLLLMRAYYHVSDGDPLTSWGLAVAHYPRFTHALAAAALVIETLYFVSLVSRRLRPYIGIAGLTFLICIRTLMGPTFESFMLCSLLVVPWHRVELALRRMTQRPRRLSTLDSAYDYVPKEVARAQPAIDARAPDTGLLGPAA